MQESVLDVILVDWPVVCESDVKNGSDRCRLDDWTEGLCEVYAFFLRFTISHKSRFVLFEATVSIIFMIVKPQ